MRDDFAALEEELAIERDADRASGALPALDGRDRPAFDGLDLCDLAGRHDDDLVARGEMAGFDAAGDDAAVVEFVDRLHRQPQRKLFQRPRRLQRVERFDHGRAAIPADPWRMNPDAI